MLLFFAHNAGPKFQYFISFRYSPLSMTCIVILNRRKFKLFRVLLFVYQEKAYPIYPYNDIFALTWGNKMAVDTQIQNLEVELLLA